MAVEEADADEREAEVVGRLEVVAGEHAEAAGVLGERGGDAELGGEVGDRSQQRRVRRGAWNQRGASRLRSSSSCTAVASAVKAVSAASFSSRSCDSVARIARGVAALELRAVRVEAAEQVLGPLVVAPPEVHGHRAEGLELLGEVGDHGERLDGLHGGEPNAPRSLAGTGVGRDVGDPAPTVHEGETWPTCPLRRLTRVRSCRDRREPRRGRVDQAAEPALMTSRASSMWDLGLNCDENLWRTTPSGSIT